MDLDVDQLVRRAASGDVPAFVELTHRFQHAAFGSALALVHDFDAAEDVVQEAFVTAWSALPRLNDPAAFSRLAQEHRAPSGLSRAAAQALWGAASIGSRTRPDRGRHSR